MSSALCVITARGGSKRIPRKNIKDFCGKPIIAYSIEVALESGIFDEVMVSTDDDEIAEVAKKYGAAIPFTRSTGASGDFATTADVVNEVLHEYALRGRRFDAVCCLYPTSPFVTCDELKNGMELINKGAHSVVPVSSYDFPPLRGFRVAQDGTLSYAFPEYAKTRSQDLPEMAHDCGRFYYARVEDFLQYGSFMTEKTQALRIPAKYVQDIDTFEDWEIAEQKYRSMMKERMDYASV